MTHQDLPAGLRAGLFGLFSDWYIGDVGGINGNIPNLALINGSAARVSVEGLGDSLGGASPSGGLAPNDAVQPHTAAFSIFGSDWLDISVIGGGHSPYGPGSAAIAVANGSVVSGSFATNMDGALAIDATAPGAWIGHYDGNMSGGAATINGPMYGGGKITLGADRDGTPSTLELKGPVQTRADYGQVGQETIAVNAGNLQLANPMRFQGAIDWQLGQANGSSSIMFEGVHADGWSMTGETFHLTAGSSDVLAVTMMAGTTQSNFHVEQLPTGVMISTLDPAHWQQPPVVLQQHG